MTINKNWLSTGTRHSVLLVTTSVLAIAAPAVLAQGFSTAPRTGSSNSIEEVIVTARVERHNREFFSSQTVKTLDQDQIKAATSVGGVASVLNLVPGVSASTYGATGSTKTTISIDGVKLGWAGFSGGNPDNGSIMVTWDGVPMTNPGNGLWQTTLVPQSSLLQALSVTYGPGNPANRYWQNVGGGLNFVPLQPTDAAGGDLELTYGSFDTKNLSFDAQTGNIDGWDTVVAGGVDASANFWKTPDHFTEDSQNWAIYLKTRKSWSGGNFALGFYATRSGAYRPLATPVTPIAAGSCTDPNGNSPPLTPCNVTLQGFNAPGAALFSEQTTGFYTTLPHSVNYKYDTNAIRIGYAKLNLSTGNWGMFHDLFYVTYENRKHWTPLHDYVLGGPTQYEINQPHTWSVGDKPSLDVFLPYNHVTLGGFLQYSYYHSREQLYNPSLPIAPGIPIMGSQSVPNGQFNSNIFTQVDTAVFVQDVITPVKSVHITPGIRWFDYYTDYTSDEQAEFPLAMLYNFGADLSSINGITPSPATSKSFSRIEPSVGANWRALSWLSLFGNWAVAYRQPEMGGGTGPFIAIPAQNVHLEQGQYYQGGAKLRWAKLGPAKDILINLTYYDLEFTHETIPTALASGGALLAFGSSSYKGVNIFADASPFRNLFTFFNLGIVDAKFTTFINGNGSTLHDVPVPYTPNANFNIGAYYQFFLGNGILLQPRISYQFTGKQHIYDNNQNITSNVKLPSFGVVNFSASLDVPVANYTGLFKTLSLKVEIDNLLNKTYNAFEYVSAGSLYGGNGWSVGQGSLLALPAPPRAVYVTLGVRF